MSPAAWRPALAVALLAVAIPAPAAQVHTRLAGPEDLRQGTLEGVSVSGKGRLALAPRLERMGSDGIAGGAAHVWAIVTDAAGNAYLGTGPDGRIVRLTPGGAEKVVFTVDDPMVTALAFVPGGDLLAGTSPGGKVWRVRPDGTGSVWCETGERYVWALAVAPDGTVYAGTGDEGLVLRIDRSGSPTPLFDSEEAHVVRLVRAGDGRLLAGGAGRGLVYRIELDGSAAVLHDDELPEIKDLVLEADGGVLATALAPAPADPRPPALRIRLPEGTGAAPEGMSGLEEGPGATLEGVIEGLSEAAREGGRGLRGRLVRIAPDGVVTELWSSASEAPYALAADPGGGAIFGTGEPGRLYRLEPSGEIALVTTLREGQVTGIARAGGVPVFATSNPAAAYRLPAAADGRGTFTSPPVDAGGIARWGLVRWDGTTAPGVVEVATRTGNSAQPDATWSAWAAARPEEGGARVSSPEGRFLQWRLSLRGGEGGAAASGVTVSYSPRNRTPSLREFRLDAPAGRSVGKEATFRWTVGDPDGDPLEVQVQFRPIAGGAWQSGARVTASDAAPDTEGMRKDGRVVWDTSSVAEGTYQVRGLVSDQPANPDGQGKEAFSEPLWVEIDRTPPEITVEREPDGSVRVRVLDAASAGGRVEILEGGQVLYAAAPDDGVADSTQETYRLSPAQGSEERILRVTDAAGNAVEQPLRGR